MFAMNAEFKVSWSMFNLQPLNFSHLTRLFILSHLTVVPAPDRVTMFSSICIASSNKFTTSVITAAAVAVPRYGGTRNFSAGLIQRSTTNSRKRQKGLTSLGSSIGDVIPQPKLVHQRPQLPWLQRLAEWRQRLHNDTDCFLLNDRHHPYWSPFPFFCLQAQTSPWANCLVTVQRQIDNGLFYAMSTILVKKVQKLFILIHSLLNFSRKWTIDSNYTVSRKYAQTVKFFTITLKHWESNDEGKQGKRWRETDKKRKRDGEGER